MTSRIYKVGDALSQLFNVALLPRHHDTNANESISGRAHRLGWKRTEAVIDWLFSRWEKDHCRLSHEADVARAEELLERQKN
jgi:cell division inhibitor SulA